MTDSAAVSGHQPAAAGGAPGAPSSLDPAELRRFAGLAERWWDPRGPMAALHRLNPTRLAYIRDRACARFGRDPLAPAPLACLRALDVGCGGGVLCEPLARLGAEVTGIDPAPENVAAAAAHAAQVGGLRIAYRALPVEALAERGEAFDLVCVMEVVEHVADVPGFLRACCRVVRPGGALVLATLNRTLRAYLLAIVGAEYVLGWLPRGTHQWSRFVTPSEAARALRAGGLAVADLTGVAYDPLHDRFRLTPDAAVNYMLLAHREGAPSAARGRGGRGRRSAVVRR
jgi:2-polyprenyl-6-hydroxyphenyl methylase/3-demethylubiquinone-9 3-methyltransferase